MPIRSRSAAIVIALLTGAVSAAASPPQARSVVIGEVSSSVERPGVDYASLLRTVSETELGSLDLTGVPRGRNVVVSISLVRLDTFAETRSVDASCAVSAVLRESRGGAVFAILEGRARARSGEAPGLVERSAVEGALHGALARIPEVLRSPAGK